MVDTIITFKKNEQVYNYNNLLYKRLHKNTVCKTKKQYLHVQNTWVYQQ